MNKQDYRDTFVLMMVSGGWVAATVFLFLYPTQMNFATWAALVATVGGIYHYLCVSDDKREDAGNVVGVVPCAGDIVTEVPEGLSAELRSWTADRQEN